MQELFTLILFGSYFHPARPVVGAQRHDEVVQPIARGLRRDNDQLVLEAVGLGIFVAVVLAALEGENAGINHGGGGRVLQGSLRPNGTWYLRGYTPAIHHTPQSELGPCGGGKGGVCELVALASHSEDCLFTLLIVSFDVQKLLSLIRSHLFIFAFISNILGGGS